MGVGARWGVEIDRQFYAQTAPLLESVYFKFFSLLAAVAEGNQQKSNLRSSLTPTAATSSAERAQTLRRSINLPVAHLEHLFDTAVAAAAVGVEDEQRFNFGLAAMRHNLAENGRSCDEKMLK